MKKTIALLLSALLLLGAMSGCGAKKEEAAQPTPEPTPASAASTPEPVQETPAPAPVTPSEPVSPDGSVIFEKDGVKVTTAGLDSDPTSELPEPIIWVEIENTGESDAYLGVTDGVINSLMGDVLLVEYYEEDGEYTGGNYTTDLTIPAGSSGKYALAYYKQAIPGVDMDTLSTLEFRFTTAVDESSWPDFTSDPVYIDAGEIVDHADFKALGTTVIDNDGLLLVIGEQDYDDFFGPFVYVYAANESDKYIALAVEKAEADGTSCDFVYYGAEIDPGKLAVGFMCFDDAIREMKGFEKLSLTFSYMEAETREGLSNQKEKNLDPVTVTYPPQVWGEYENKGMKLEIRPKINDLITVDTPEENKNGILFSIFETASLEAEDFDGAGLLCSVGIASEEQVHDMLCYDMSGVEPFARDAEGNYYIYYYPTDVRYARATAEEMQRDAEQWSMLCQWAEDTVRNAFTDQNGLESVQYGNTELDMYLARAVWQKDVNCYLATTEFMDVDADLVDGTPFVEYVMHGYFGEIQPEDLPDEEYLSGENLVLGFLPDEDVLIHFFPADGAYVRIDRGDEETYYQAAWWDDDVSYYEAMLGWYYAAAEKAGKKPHEDSLDRFCGDWHEQIAGRGTVTISKSLAPGKAMIEASWPESAAVRDEWKMIATLDGEGRLAYKNGTREVIESDEEGDSWTADFSDEESGWFYFNDAGALCWHNESMQDAEDSVFLSN